jgi:hypothetical protein
VEIYRFLRWDRSCRQVSRRPGFACSAGEPDQEFVAIDEETERELEYQALQEAKAASYEFPEKYKHSIMAPTMPTPIFDSQEVIFSLHSLQYVAPIAVAGD